MILTAGIEIFGHQKNILGIHLGPFLHFFILGTSLRVHSKNGALGNLGLVMLAVFILRLE